MLSFTPLQYRSSVRFNADHPSDWMHHRDISAAKRHQNSRRSPPHLRNMYAQLVPLEQDAVLARAASNQLPTPVSSDDTGAEAQSASRPPKHNAVRQGHRVKKRQPWRKGTRKAVKALLSPVLSTQVQLQADHVKLQSQHEELRSAFEALKRMVEEGGIRAPISLAGSDTTTNRMVNNQMDAEMREHGWKFDCEPGTLTSEDLHELRSSIPRLKGVFLSAETAAICTRDELLKAYDYAISGEYMFSNKRGNYSKLHNEHIWLGLRIPIEDSTTRDELMAEIGALVDQYRELDSGIKYLVGKQNERVTDHNPSSWCRLMDECAGLSLLPEETRNSLSRWETYPTSLTGVRLWNREKRCCYHCLENLVRNILQNKSKKREVKGKKSKVC